jgi:hypothetical protein
MDAAKPGPSYDPNPALRRKRVLDIGIGLVLGLVLTGIGTGGLAVLRPSPSQPWMLWYRMGSPAPIMGSSPIGAFDTRSECFADAKKEVDAAKKLLRPESLWSGGPTLDAKGWTVVGDSKGEGVGLTHYGYECWPQGYKPE